MNLICFIFEFGLFVNNVLYMVVVHMYYCMTGRAIQGNIPFKIDRIGPTKGRQDTEIKNRIFPILPDPRIAIIYLLYEFHITIVTGNNERAIR